MRMMMGRTLGLPVVVWAALIALALCDLILLTAMPHALKSWAATVLAILLPGWLLVNLLLRWRARLGMGERFVFGVGAGFGLQVTLMLGLSYLPGGLSFAQVAVSFHALVLLLAAINVLPLRGSPPPLRFPVIKWA